MRSAISNYENSFRRHMISRERLLKAIRNVKSNGFTAPGKIPSTKNSSMIQYESGLEKDFAYFLEFSSGIKRFVEQPVKIEFTAPNGKPASYTPDFLAYYSDQPEFKNLKPTLFEVKTRKHLKKNWSELKPKFLAALRYCDTQGWNFKIITEQELNTPYVQNAKFLAPYMRRTPGIGLINNVFDALHELEDSATPANVIAIASNDFYRKAALVPALWYLIATRQIQCDLDNPLTMDSEIWYIKN